MRNVSFLHLLLIACVPAVAVARGVLPAVSPTTCLPDEAALENELGATLDMFAVVVETSKQPLVVLMEKGTAGVGWRHQLRRTAQGCTVETGKFARPGDADMMRLISSLDVAPADASIVDASWHCTVGFLTPERQKRVVHIDEPMLPNDVVAAHTACVELLEIAGASDVAAAIRADLRATAASKQLWPPPDAVPRR